MDTHLDLPPLGPWYKLDDNPVISTNLYLPENIAYDSVTEKYWMVFTNVTGASIGIAYSADLETWTVSNASLISAPATGAAPHLMLDGSTWYIFYSKVGTGSKITLFIASCSTPNGTYSAGTEILTCGSGGSWDDERVMEAFVIKDDDGTYKMLYMGDAGTAPNFSEQIGLATASAITGPWTKYVSNPVITFGTSGAFDAGTVADPHIVKVNGIYYVFYTGSVTAAAPWYTALATSTDLITYTKRGIVFAGGPLGAVDSFSAFRGGIILANDKYFFAYAGGSENNANYKICMAISPAKALRAFT